ncbi:ssl1498 family light-harvesting-like protein [Oculatella sp. FACHB-28]|uniref:photosystem II assembly protein Psb34 n=1 Tax=Cyanophyceae TaxID=3028117 RepID=UPI0016879A39|nr:MULTISPECIES: ssl1498 family light-harvesting-like protein [Cyanophyceae]MBD2000312.1 ssl1498 family light-harvesting-like protein [Leptolyngbya sp. FACHB-541]MBD2058081.1 ssl1498 family light-harvesting-like protein [Oculatella sp. FACHB-28]
MPYTTEEGGRLNNFAVEPKIYQAEPPTQGQQRNYIILSVAAIALIGGLLFIAVSVS